MKSKKDNQHTGIQWTNRTWNPFRGCSLVSKGCVNCYAMYQAHRYSGPGEAYEGLTINTASGPRWNGEVKIVEDALNKPLHWRKPSKIFVNSMSDMFHEKIPLEDIHRVFDVMRRANQHQFQILTKRSRRLVELNNEIAWPDNVWMGVSIEDNPTRQRIADLTLVDANVRFLSIEPLLDDLPNLVLDGIHWVIIGGESGFKARQMQEGWVSAIIDDCKRQNVPVFVKQMGSVWAKNHNAKDSKGGDIDEWSEHLKVRDYPDLYNTVTDRDGGETLPLF